MRGAGRRFTSASSNGRGPSPCAGASGAISANACNSAGVAVCGWDRSDSTSGSGRTAIRCHRSAPSRWRRRFRSTRSDTMKRLLVGTLFAAALTACGQGRAIFNVDAYSFMSGAGRDTIHYTIPPGGGTASTVQQINLPPGFGKSIVDSVRITKGYAYLFNTGGTGSIGFALFFAADSASTYTTPAALNIAATAVNGVQGPDSGAITGDLSSTANSLFSQQALWIRFAATATR